MEQKLRSAGIHDLETLLHWDEQDHVRASDPNDDWNWQMELTRNPRWREQLIFEVDGHSIGFVQIIDPAKEESNYWGSVRANLRAIDIWIGNQENLGKGYGTIMMKLALQRCFSDDKVTAVIIDPLQSNKRTHKFYERIGFRFIETRVFGKDTCRVYRFDRKDWETTHLNASPGHSSSQ